VVETIVEVHGATGWLRLRMTENPRRCQHGLPGRGQMPIGDLDKAHRCPAAASTEGAISPPQIANYPPTAIPIHGA